MKGRLRWPLGRGGRSKGSGVGALREVYDGYCVRDVGTDGGRKIEWRGRLGIVGACTTAWDQAHAVIASMGDRFVCIRADSSVGREEGGTQECVSLLVFLVSRAGSDGWPARRRERRSPKRCGLTATLTWTT